jgi:hypothetical protein
MEIKPTQVRLLSLSLLFSLPSLPSLFHTDTHTYHVPLPLLYIIYPLSFLPRSFFWPFKSNLGSIPASFSNPPFCLSHTANVRRKRQTEAVPRKASATAEHSGEKAPVELVGEVSLRRPSTFFPPLSCSLQCQPYTALSETQTSAFSINLAIFIILWVDFAPQHSHTRLPFSPKSLSRR